MAPPAHLDAQVESSVELGASRLRQANVPTSNALSGGATLDVLGDRSQLRASVLASRQTESRWTGQAALFGSITGNSPSSWWQLDATATDYAQTSSGPTTSFEAAARARAGSGLRGVAFGFGGGTSLTGGHSGGVQRALGDGWWVLDRERFVASLGWTRANPPLFLSGSISYTDLSAGWRASSRGAVRIRTPGNFSTRACGSRLTRRSSSRREEPSPTTCGGRRGRRG